jgi:hypothetical protein
MSKAASSRADDKTNELKHLNRSMLRPGFVWNKEAKRMEEEKRITDRHIDETSQRAKAKLDVQQTQQVRLPSAEMQSSLSLACLWLTPPGTASVSSVSMTVG